MVRPMQLWIVYVSLWLTCGRLLPSHATEFDAKAIQAAKGLVVIAGAPTAEQVIEAAQNTDAILLIQSSNKDSAQALRSALQKRGLLGRRVYVEEGLADRIPLADNLADQAIHLGDSANQSVREELERIVHPNGRLTIGGETTRVPRPEGADDWSHPYHGPDNNPQSSDQTARAPYLTQFLAEPWYVPMPQVTVASGGRVFKAFGHIALKEREWPWLNSLVAINGYNGALLWKRPLEAGFMVHRNTLVATPNTVYLADSQSCKLLDAETGAVRDEIRIDKALDPDGVWKWLSLADGRLIALIGDKEKLDTTIRGDREQPGWPWSGLGKGYAANYSWGFGRLLVCFDAKTKKLLWKVPFENAIDSRATCMAAGRIFLYSDQKELACVNAESGDTVWRTSDPKLLDAIGKHGRAQNPRLGFSSSAYAKANEHGVYFAGPQRERLVGVSAKTGKLMWSYPHGNFQLVLREDGLYAMGRMETSKLFNYLTGEVIADLECYRGNCTRATGAVDSIFTRGYRHTGTMRLDLTGNYPRRIPLMRPACQDGVVISDGLLYWGPWMCDCNHSLVGMISLAPAGDFDFSRPADETRTTLDSRSASAFPATDGRDWAHYRGDAARVATSSVTIPERARFAWRLAGDGSEPTAPVTSGSMVFWSGLDGVVHAADAASGERIWTATTGGAVRFPPEIEAGRVFVGSSDGSVYAFDAATGERLWRFQAAPRDRRILVHSRLMSTWPVGSGVLVRNGVVYAAAGITSYDGTHVYALDAKTGQVIWQNNTSGRLVNDQQVTGVSVQGHLLLHGDVLYLAGGNVVSPARYDAKTGKCLNKLENEWWDRPAASKEQFPSKPTGEMFRRSPRGRELFLVDGSVRVFDQLLYSPAKYGQSRYFGGHFLQGGQGDRTVRGTNGRVVRLSGRKTEDGKPIGLWQSDQFANPAALAVTENVVLVAGERAREDSSASPKYSVAALSLKTGKALWSRPLPTEPVSWGLAVGREGRVVVALHDGQLLCIASDE